MLSEAISEKIRRALAAAKTLQKGGHLADARRACDLVLTVDPGNPDALLRLGLIALREGAVDEALGRLGAALSRQPQNTYIIRLMASIQRDNGRIGEAERLLNSTLSFAPDDAGLLVERGRCLMDRGDISAATPLFERAAAADPSYAPAFSMLGIAYRRMERGEEAFAMFRKAIELAPDDAAAQNGVGNEYLEIEDFDRAIAHYRQAIAVKPDFASARKNLAFALGLANRLEEAEAAFAELIRIAPDNDEAHMDYGLFLLSIGAYGRGWREYEHRWKVPKFVQQDWGLGLPRWDGVSASPDPVLLWGEQGVGDQILYGTFLQDVIDRSEASFVIAVDPRLVPLFGRSFGGPRVQVVEHGRPVAAAAQCPFGSLGWLARNARTDFGPGKYLQADPGRRDHLHEKYRRLGGGARVVGLSWRSINWTLGARKSLDLAQMLPVLGQPGVFWVNLQYGEVGAEIARLASDHGIHIYQDPEVDPLKDLDGLAAQIAALDGVISSSNSTVHFAGGLGVRCHVLLPAGRGRMWYWPREGETSPWYDSIRLVRQNAAGDWSQAIMQARDRLGQDV